MKAVRILALLFALAPFAQAQHSDVMLAVRNPQEHRTRQPSVQPMTLGDLEVAALENNPEIKLLTRRVAAFEARVGIAGALDDSVFMYRGWGVPLREPWNFNQPQNMFMVTQALPGPGKRALRAQIATHETDIARTLVEAKKREVQAKVRAAFYELLRNQEDLRLHGEQVALARQAAESARIKYTVGRVPQQDVLKAQIALSKLVDHLVMFEQEGQMARATLNTLLGRNPGAPLEVVGKYAPPGTLPARAELELIALQNRAELHAATTAVKQAETKERLTGKAYTPDFTVGAGYMLMPPGSRFRSTYMAEISFTLPWFNRRRHEAEIAEAKAEAHALKAAYERERAIVLQEIQEALIRAEAARRLVELYRDTLRPQSQATLRAASAAYQTDRTDFLNLLDSQNTALEVEYAYFRALSEYERRLADLERAIGAPLSRGQETAVGHTAREVRQ